MRPRPLCNPMLAVLVALVGVADGQSAPTYGETPEALQPYSGSDGVSWRFYQNPQSYYGPGAEAELETAPATVRIGLMIPAPDAPDGELGESLRRGVALRIDQANDEARELGSIPYELVVRHDSGAWGAASNTLVQLAYDEDVWAVIGSVDASSTHVALRVALKAEMPMVNTASTDPTVTETGIPWILRCYPDDRQHGYRLARLVLEEHGHERPAVLRVNDKYGRMGVAEFRDAARRLGRPLVLEVRHDRGEHDFSAQVERIAKMHADAVVLWSPAEDAGRAAAALRAAGLRLPLYGADRLVSERFLAAAGEAAEGTLATTPLDPRLSSDVWTAFRSKYHRAYACEPDAFGAFAYDGAALLLGAIETAGLDRQRIRSTLAAIESAQGVTGPMRFDTTQNNVGRIHVTQVRDGRFVPYGGP